MATKSEKKIIWNSGDQPIQIAGEMSTGYHFRSSVPMAPDTSASCFCEGLGGPKRLASHLTGQKTEAQIVAQRHTALQIAEQEMGWGPLPLESVLCSGYPPPNSEMDQMSPESPIQKVSSEKAGALSQGSPPGASGATSHLTPGLHNYTPVAHSNDCKRSQTTVPRLQASEPFVISRVFPCFAWPSQPVSW